MISFYGGRKGDSFTISGTYSYTEYDGLIEDGAYQAMIEDFKKGNEARINYGEYALLYHPTAIEHGDVYKRLYPEGAEKIGNFSGPIGEQAFKILGVFSSSEYTGKAPEELPGIPTGENRDFTGWMIIDDEDGLLRAFDYREEKWVKVGLKPGRTTEEGGEIFNDYINNEASDNYTHAEGENTTAFREAAHAEGKSTVATGLASHAEGIGGGVAGSGAHEEGAHAEGINTTAAGKGSHAEGVRTQAIKEASHSQGLNSIASGIASHAEGESTEAKKEASHAEGVRAIANGDCSHAEGYYTIASGNYQHVQGKYNIEDTKGDYAHIVGWGTAEDKRENIYTLSTNGDAKFKGDLSIAGENIYAIRDDKSYKIFNRRNFSSSSTDSITISSLDTETIILTASNKDIGYPFQQDFLSLYYFSVSGKPINVPANDLYAPLSVELMLIRFNIQSTGQGDSNDRIEMICQVFNPSKYTVRVDSAFSTATCIFTPFL